MAEDKVPALGTAEYYKQKGLTRYTIIFPESHKAKVDIVAGQYGLTAGDVIEVLIDRMNVADIAEHLQFKRDNKVDGRTKGTPKKKLVESLKGLSPEQLSAIEAQIKKMRSAE